MKENPILREKQREWLCFPLSMVSVVLHKWQRALNVLCKLETKFKVIKVSEFSSCGITELYTEVARVSIRERCNGILTETTVYLNGFFNKNLR